LVSWKKGFFTVFDYVWTSRVYVKGEHCGSWAFSSCLDCVVRVIVDGCVVVVFFFVVRDDGRES
jgi:hypothetical protein